MNVGRVIIKPHDTWNKSADLNACDSAVNTKTCCFGSPVLKCLNGQGRKEECSYIKRSRFKK